VSAPNGQTRSVKNEVKIVKQNNGNQNSVKYNLNMSKIKVCHSVNKIYERIGQNLEKFIII